METETGKPSSRTSGWDSFYQNSAEHKAFLEESTKDFDELLTQVGLKK